MRRRSRGPRRSRSRALRWSPVAAHIGHVRPGVVEPTLGFEPRTCCLRIRRNSRVYGPCRPRPWSDTPRRSSSHRARSPIQHDLRLMWRPLRRSLARNPLATRSVGVVNHVPTGVTAGVTPRVASEPLACRDQQRWSMVVSPTTAAGVLGNPARFRGVTFRRPWMTTPVALSLHLVSASETQYSDRSLPCRGPWHEQPLAMVEGAERCYRGGLLPPPVLGRT
jgi:hypothetical protein